jgi:hypothetical protein
MADRTTPRLFAALLVAHALHVGEEAWGRFWLVDAVFGLCLFLLLNLIGLLLVCGVFVALRRGLRWGFVVGACYAGFMALQGIGHGLAWLATDRYFGGFAGAITGVALAVLGTPLSLRLYRRMPGRALSGPSSPASER